MKKNTAAAEKLDTIVEEGILCYLMLCYVMLCYGLFWD